MSADQAISAIVGALSFSLHDWAVVIAASAGAGFVSLIAFNRVARLTPQICAMAAVDGLQLGGFGATGFVASQNLRMYDVPSWWTLVAIVLVIVAIVIVGDISRRLVGYDQALFIRSLDARPDGPAPTRPHIQNLEG